MNHASLKALGVALVAALPLVASAQLSGNLAVQSRTKGWKTQMALEDQKQ